MDGPTKQNSLATMPYQKIKMNIYVHRILHLLDGKRIIMYSTNGSFRVWDLETGTQVGEEWEDKEQPEELGAIIVLVLSPDGKKIASAGNRDGAVKLWNVDTGKVIKTLTGHTGRVGSVSWSPDGGRVVSGSADTTFRVWDVESGKTILGPINILDTWEYDSEEFVYHHWVVCYSPDAKMIATGARNFLHIRDANTGKSLKTPSSIGLFVSSLAWTWDGKTLVVGGLFGITKFDTATWTDHKVQVAGLHFVVSPNGRILASTSILDPTPQLWDLETGQFIGAPLNHQQGNLEPVKSMTFSADGKFFVTCCGDHIYIWDVSAIVKEAGLPSDIADVTPRPAQNTTGARQIPPGFFDDALREANLRIRPSHAPDDRPTLTPRQRILSPFASFWHSSKPHEASEPTTKSQSRPFSWTRNLSGMLRRGDGSEMRLREVQVPCTAGKPRNYHARKKPAASSSRPCNTHTTQQHSMATQNTSSSLQLPPPTAATSTLSAVAGSAGATGTPRPRITIDSGWRTRFVLWFCCMPVQHTDGQN
ncbi:hypothetical protein CY34DRAFT_808920 [Suillus luteus UH-Slu-Lm8-n1]|uniref:WD40 repeat-like protein n=1 Tax=Suillus luteus UH-Slu-Lm8-n1 TaxID=930992 RepID=A0A0D0AAT0_9AGAM|nr:hypothetical protein CY34DRAFT_808920 [Suillus luteus UH-Slu-Lm8-n1]